MKKILLEIAGLLNSQTQSGAFTLVLSDEENGRRLPILIGFSEAQAIAMVIDNMTPQRPLTHDLFKNFATAFSIQLSEVIIYSLKEGVFYAKLICTDGNLTQEIDARTSDAVALAIRFNCPIYTFESIMSQAGIAMDEEQQKSKRKFAEVQKPEKKKPKPSADFASQSIDELNELLNLAIQDEAYERASRIRDEINKRQSKS